AKKAVSKVYNAAKKVVVDTYNTVKKVVVNTYNTIKSAVGHAVNWVGQKVNQAVNWAGNAVRQTTNWIGQQFTSQRGYNNSTRNYVTYQQSEAQRQAIAQQQYQQRVNQEYITATGIKGQPKTREAQNLIKNWGPALSFMYTHVCKTANHWVDSGVKFLKNVDWKDVLKNAAGIAGEFFYVNDIYRVITGTDPITGEKASRLEAAAWLATDLISMGGSKFGKLAKVATKADNLFDVVKGSKIVTRANKAIDGAKTFIKSSVGKLLDTPFGFSPQLAGVGGMTMNAGGTTLREVGQNVKKGFDNLVQAFAKNGDEGNKAYKNSRPKYAKGQVDEVFKNAQKSNNGKVIDPSGKEIIWDKTKPRNGQWDMGHIPGEKYSEMHKKYMDGHISKEEFLKWFRNPKNYRPELPSTNRGHKYE
ncbi:GH-E family nuclease, partial [Streptococcus suis]